MGTTTTRDPRDVSHTTLGIVGTKCIRSSPTFANAGHNGEPVEPPGFCNRGEVRYGSIGGLEYEVPHKLTHLLQCIGNV